MHDETHIDNYLITRFSLRIQDWATRAYGDEVNREAWFASRASMFLEGLFASVRAQTKPVLGHLLLMDSGDVRLFEKYLDVGPPLVPLFSTNAESHPRACEYLSTRGNTENLAISRVDSDDLVAFDYVERVSRCISVGLSKQLAFNFVVASDGFVTDFEQIQTVHHPTSPFLTQFSRRWSGERLFGFSHREIGQKPHIVCQEARWMICLHGSNLMNAFMNETALEDAARSRRKGKKHALPRTPVSTHWPEAFVQPGKAVNAQPIARPPSASQSHPH